MITRYTYHIDMNVSNFWEVGCGEVMWEEPMLPALSVPETSVWYVYINKSLNNCCIYTVKNDHKIKRPLLQVKLLGIKIWCIDPQVKHATSWQVYHRWVIYALWTALGPTVQVQAANPLKDTSYSILKLGPIPQFFNKTWLMWCFSYAD